MRERGFCYVWNCMIFLMLQFELKLNYFSNFIYIGPSFLANRLNILLNRNVGVVRFSHM
jgi:hypothetical protein